MINLESQIKYKNGRHTYTMFKNNKIICILNLANKEEIEELENHLLETVAQLQKYREGTKYD